jgi:hypothetical protein
MTNTQRKGFLLKNIPDVCLEPFPEGRFSDEAAKSNTNYGLWVRKSAYPRAPLAYWLNRATLTDDPTKFLDLLQSRINHDPEDWAEFDYLGLQPAWESGALEIEYCNCSVIMHGDNYGQPLLSYEESAHRLDAIGYPRAKLVLEAQAWIMSVIKRVVKGIVTNLHPLNSSSTEGWEDLSSQQWMNSSIKSSSQAEHFSSHLHQPFSQPPRFSPEKVKSIAEAAYKANLDHMWLLQIEPEYLKHTIRLIEEGEAVEMLKVAADLGNFRQLVITELLHSLEITRGFQLIMEELSYITRLAHSMSFS